MEAAQESHFLPEKGEIQLAARLVSQVCGQMSPYIASRLSPSPANSTMARLWLSRRW